MAIRRIMVVGAGFMGSGIAQVMAAAGDHDRAFYAGKIASARYYLNQVLPQAFSQTAIIRNEDRIAIEVPEEIFTVF